MGKEKQKLNNFALPVNITDNLIEWLPTNFWTDPTKKVCYLSIVDGYVIDRMIDKFNEGLKDIIVDDNERKNHILDNMIYGISSTESNTRRVKWLSHIKNIYTRNILKEDISDMPQFDFVVQNPPYNGSLHLDFLKKGYEMLSDKGQMIIIEPAAWLINLNKNSEYTTGKRGNLTPTIKKEINKHVKRVIIENYNKEFNTANTVPFSITHIDKSKNYDKIDFTCFGINTQVDTIYDCNLIGNSKLINSIFNKIKNCDTAKNHVINEQLNNDKIYYCQISQIIWTIAGLYYQRPQFALSNTAYYKLDSGEYYQSCLAGVIHISRNDITNIIPKKAARGGSSKGKVKLTNNPAKCIYGSQEELINWKHFVFKNSLPLFINMAIIIDQNNSVLQFIPWLVDKKYTDEEIYKMFNFTDEEINLIETTIKKFERNSPWFKRYMCGPSEVTDEEVQKFINNL